MVQEIVTVSGYLLKSQAGDQLKPNEIDEAMALLAKPTDQLRYDDPKNLPRHSQSDCDSALEMTPEERCTMFLDGIRLGIQGRAGSNPHQSAYRILRMSSKTLPEEVTGLWEKVLDSYRDVHHLQTG